MEKSNCKIIKINGEMKGLRFDEAKILKKNPATTTNKKKKEKTNAKYFCVNISTPPLSFRPMG